MKNQIRIGTFNIRYGDADDNLNSWANRRDLVIESLDINSPDIVGFQEVLPHVKDFLETNLPEYTVVGNGREKDLQGESNCIAFKKKLFEVISLETLWLSDRPYVPGSQFQNNDGCPRICTHITLRSKISNQLFRVFNTHLDYRFSSIRLKQLGVLKDFINEAEGKISLPILLIGDFNCTPNSKEISYILNDFELNFQDLSTVEQIKSNITFHDYYSAKENKAKIDYIFATENIMHIKSYIDDTEKGGIYLSDHYPVYAVVGI